MINLIKSNNPINYVIIFLIMMILWAYKFYFMPTPIESYFTTNLIFPTAPETIFFKYFSAIIAFAFFYVCAILIIKINSDLLIIENSYQSAGVIFAILTGTYINAQRLLPETISGFLIFFAIAIIMYSYQKHKAFTNSYNAGLLFGIAVLLYVKFIVFFPLLIVALLITKTIQWREPVILLTGVLTPLFLYFSFTYLYGDIGIVSVALKEIPVEKIIRTKYGLYNILILAPIFLFVLISIISRYSIKVSKKVFSRKAQSLLVIIVLVFTVFLISPIAGNESICILYAPMALLLSNILVNAKSKFGMIIMIVLFVGIGLSQFLQIMFYRSIF